MITNKTPDYYYINKEKNLTVDKVLNNFAGGLNIWRSNVLKYSVRAFNKHSSPITCLNKALRCVYLEEEREQDDIEKWNRHIIKPVNFIKDFNIHKEMLNFEVFVNIEFEEYKKFLVEIYKWCVGLSNEKPITELIQEQINNNINN